MHQLWLWRLGIVPTDWCIWLCVAMHMRRNKLTTIVIPFTNVKYTVREVLAKIAGMVDDADVLVEIGR